MAKLVNLRRARKTRKRDEKRAEAEKRTSPAPTSLDTARAALEQRRIDGHKRDDDRD